MMRPTVLMREMDLLYLDASYILISKKYISIKITLDNYDDLANPREYI